MEKSSKINTLMQSLAVMNDSMVQNNKNNNNNLNTTETQNF